MKAIKKLQTTVDELIVQLDLGRMEAIDRVEKAKQRLDTIVKRISDSREAVTQPVKHALGELQLQLKLGRMETRDAYYHQLDQLARTIEAADKVVSETRHEAEEDFKDAASNLLDKVHLLGFHIEMAEKRAVDEIRAAKNRTKEGLVELKEKILETVDTADEKAHEAASECHLAYDDIRSNLATLFKHR